MKGYNGRLMMLLKNKVQNLICGVILKLTIPAPVMMVTFKDIE